MRIDKFLKVSRILKRRSVANEVCTGGRVDVNGRQCKPSTQIKEGDVVTIGYANGKLSFRVLKIAETVRKEDAERMYEVIQV